MASQVFQLASRICCIMSDDVVQFSQLRSASFAIAYRMLGSVSEAEDIVQESLLRISRALDAGEPIESPRAYIATITTRLAINELRSARARRERYVGAWLPEPIITSDHSRPSSAQYFCFMMSSTTTTGR